VEGSNQHGEQIAEAQVEQQGLDQTEELNEEAENEEDMEEVEDQDNEDLAEAVGSWPVLSKYQSTRFQYQILTKDMFRSRGFSGLKLTANTCLGIHDMRKLLKSKTRAPKGQDLCIICKSLSFFAFNHMAYGTHSEKEHGRKQHPLLQQLMAMEIEYATESSKMSGVGSKGDIFHQPTRGNTQCCTD